MIVDDARGLGVECLPCSWCPAPNGAMEHATLYPFQKVGAAWLSRARAALLADEVGLGKTGQALAAWQELGHPPAVAVVLPSTRRQWAREVGRWAPGGRVHVQEGGSGVAGLRRGELRVVGYPALRGVLSYAVPAGTLVVLDEAQAIKDPSTQQTRGARALCAAALEGGGRVWQLTATPAYADAEQAWQVLRASELHRALDPSLAAWSYLAPAEQAKRLARVMLRRRAQDELQLPPLRFETVVVEIGEAQADEIDRAVDEAIARATDAAEEPLTAGEVRAALTAEEVRAALERLAEEDDALPFATLRRLLALAKLPRVLDLVAEHEEEGAPLVVFSDHRDPVLALQRRPGWGAVLGGQTTGERDETVQRFMTEGAGLAVTFGAGGTGLDGLQRRASRALLVELPWTPAAVEQALGRLLRIGQVGGSVLVSLLVCDHWADAIVTGVVRRKLGRLDGLGLGLSLAGGCA